MSQLYARVFLQILDSSVAENWQTRHVFEDFLKLANDGVVDMTRQAISRRTNVPLEIVNAAIAELESPDPASRDSEQEGRRLVRLDNHRDWGWHIVNWQKYEDIKRASDVRDQTRERVSKFRSKQNQRPASEPTTATEAEAAPEAKGPLHERYRALQSVTVTQEADHARFPEAPSLESVKLKAAMVGLPEWKAEDFFQKFDSVGWVDKNGNAIRNWESLLARERTFWQADGCPAKPHGRNGASKPRRGTNI